MGKVPRFSKSKILFDMVIAITISIFSYREHSKVCHFEEFTENYEGRKIHFAYHPDDLCLKIVSYLPC